MSSPETYLAAFLCGGLLCLVVSALFRQAADLPGGADSH